MKSVYRNLFWIGIFSITMGFLETAVVIYLRKLYYPGGFRFPLAVIPGDVARIEILREVATLIMLLGAGILTGRNTSQRFAFFVFAFAIWDIFYYVFLKIFLNWPESLHTWDILFLIPVPWIGPVLAPCLVSLTMIVLTLVILIHSEMGFQTKLRFTEWMLLGSGSLIIIFSFCTDYLHLLIRLKSQAISIGMEEDLFSDIRQYIPVSYNWQMFGAGEMMIMIAILVYVLRIRKKEQIGAHSLECFSDFTDQCS
jgi:hypothetical protein